MRQDRHGFRYEVRCEVISEIRYRGNHVRYEATADADMGCALVSDVVPCLNAGLNPNTIAGTRPTIKLTHAACSPFMSKLSVDVSFAHTRSASVYERSSEFSSGFSSDFSSE